VTQPQNGYFATANNAPPGHEQHSPLGIDWMASYRNQAICKALEEKAGWTVADCQLLQTDQHSQPWREIREIVLAAIEDKPCIPTMAFDELKVWQGELSSDSYEAALFEYFLAEMCVRVARAKAPKSFKWLLGKTAWGVGVNLFYLKRTRHLTRLLREQPSGWFKRPWQAEIADAMAESLQNTIGFAWGQVHTLRPKSLVF